MLVKWQAVTVRCSTATGVQGWRRDLTQAKKSAMWSLLGYARQASAGTVAPFAALPDGKTSAEWNAITLLDGAIVAVGGGACGTTMALPEVYFLPGVPVN